MARLSDRLAANSPYATPNRSAPKRDALDDIIDGHVANLAEYARNKQAGITGSALDRLRAPLENANFTPVQIGQWASLVLMSGGTSLTTLRSKIRAALPQAIAS
jgi:hypothetical protein